MADCTFPPDTTEQELCLLREATEATAAATKAIADKGTDAENWALILETASSLILALVAVALLIMLWPLIRTIANRDWSKIKINIGGIAVDAETSADKTKQLVSDLQSELIALTMQVDAFHNSGASGGAHFRPEPPTSAVPAGNPSAPTQPGPFQAAAAPVAAKDRLDVVWVDGSPENVAYEMEILRSLGHDVTPLSSTSAVKERLSLAPMPDVIISDSDRTGDTFGSNAGTGLLAWVRAEGFTSPDGQNPMRFVIYTQGASLAAARKAIKASDKNAFATDSFSTIRMRLIWLQNNP